MGICAKRNEDNRKNKDVRNSGDFICVRCGHQYTKVRDGVLVVKVRKL